MTGDNMPFHSRFTISIGFFSIPIFLRKFCLSNCTSVLNYLPSFT